MKRLTIILKFSFLILSVTVGPVFCRENEVNPRRESPPAYIVLSFVPVSGNQIPEVVHSLGNDYLYYREVESKELRDLDNVILKRSPLRILVNGEIVREVAFNALGTGNSLGDHLCFIRTEEGEQIVELKIAPSFDPVSLNFLGQEIEVRPEALSLSPRAISVKAVPGEVRHIQIEDFAVDIAALSPGEAPAVFGLKYRMSLNLDQRIYLNLDEIRDQLRGLYCRPSLDLEPMSANPAATGSDR